MHPEFADASKYIIKYIYNAETGIHQKFSIILISVKFFSQTCADRFIRGDQLKTHLRVTHADSEGTDRPRPPRVFHIFPLKSLETC